MTDRPSGPELDEVVGPDEPLRAVRHPVGRLSTDQPTTGFKTTLLTHGWRVVAIVALLVLTGYVLLDGLPGGSGRGAGTDDPGFGALSSDAAGTGVVGAPPHGDGRFATDLPSGALPDGGPVAVHGSNTWHIVPGTTGQVGRGTERVFSYTVEVEDGVDAAGFGGDGAFAAMVDQTLANPKSWTKDERFGFRRIEQGEPDFRISLTSQMTTREACGFDIPIDSSCYSRDIGRVVLDEARWVRGAIAFQGDVGSYRQYQINHEVGHAIGYYQHQPCEADGALAPVMMQQTFGTANDDIARLDPEGVVPMDGKVCRFNPWPYPRG
ncbi:DUF3152 domain-containing protein [Skermania piniformis]|uniref:DUF3152 domain-containing protein n=1 Tax=Skermania pinensis TaxID=39122 RepID=UPI00278C321B|nr:DUF3152 domain-containing protein [Skermania piniformis]